jgi:hypothetical protein
MMRIISEALTLDTNPTLELTGLIAIGYMLHSIM